jgi:hypothetical protein
MEPMNFNWNRVNVYYRAKSSEVGSIRVSENDQPVIALKKYGNVTWEPLNTLSGSMWKQCRLKASETIYNIFKDGEKIIRLEAIESIKNEAVGMVYMLYNDLSPIKKKEFLKKHQDTFLGQTTCHNCLANCLCEAKQKCVNHECSGMCAKCYEEIGDKCLVCDAEQIVECPICQETKDGSSVCKSANCRHSVCWDCYGRAFHSGHPIMNCPLCRDTFTIDQDDPDIDSDDDGPLHFSELEDELNHVEIEHFHIGNDENIPDINFGDVEMVASNNISEYFAARLQIEEWNQLGNSRLI